MLNVEVGLKGKVRLEKRKNHHDSPSAVKEFYNTWTDVGLSKISRYMADTGTSDANINRIFYGVGVHDSPFSNVTNLKKLKGSGQINFEASDALSYEVDEENNKCIVTVEHSITVPATGQNWNLTEIGIGNSMGGFNPTNTAFTYTLVKDDLGNYAPYPVEDIEILTIYYSVIFEYPLTLPPQPVDVEGLPPTTARFIAKLPGSPGVQYWLSKYFGTGRDGTFTYTDENFNGSSGGTRIDNRYTKIGLNQGNRSNKYMGHHRDVFTHIWELDPPIEKNNTQELDIEIYWSFQNAVPTRGA